MKLSDFSRFKKPLKTKPKEEDKGFLDYAWDALAAGTGRGVEDIAGSFFRLNRGNRDLEEFRNDPDFSSMRALEDWGREVYESRHNEFEPQSWQWYLNSAAESLPESLGIMGGSMLLGSTITPAVGTAGGAASGFIRSLPILGKGVQNLAKAYQAYSKGSGTGARIARAFTPDARTISSAIPAAYMETELEAQGVYNQALATGMSVEEAEHAASDSRAKNFGIISFMNVPAHKYWHGLNPQSVFGVTRPTQQGLLGKVGKFAGYNILPEGFEEGMQSVANQSALPFGYDPQEWFDSFIVGDITGLGMGGAGAIANRVANGKQPSYEEQLANWRNANKLRNDIEATKYARKKYETLHGGETRRQAQYEAQKETNSQMRDWARDKSSNLMTDEAYNLIVQAANKYNVPVEHALAQAFAESDGYANIEDSPAGAIGIMQLMPDTAAELNVDPRNLAQNIDGGVRYLKERYDEFGDWDLAHAAYNAGAGAVRRFGGVPYGGGYEETREYVDKINGFLSQSPQYDTSKLSDSIYRGENGKGEGKYWERNPNMSVSFEGAQPQLLNAVDMLAQKYFKDTGKRLVINAGTNGNHAEGEHSHKNGWKVDIVDAGGSDVSMTQDGPLFTANYGKGHYLDEFIAYGRSLGLGMNLEGLGTSNVHLDVALDGTQWDGNGDNAGGFNPNVSTQGRANELYNQRITEGFQRERTTPQQSQQEETKPLFDINAEDTLTQKLIEQFALDRTQTAIQNKDADTLNFFLPMLDGNSFVNTEENRKALYDRYGDELSDFVTGNISQTNPEQSSISPATRGKTVSAPQGDYKQQVKVAGRKYLEELNKTADKSKAETAIKLLGALSQNKTAEIENILKANGIAITAPQAQAQEQSQPAQPNQQEQPVSKNKPPKNILPQPKLTQEYRDSVFDATIPFIDKIRAGAKDDKLSEEEKKAFQDFISFFDEHEQKFSLISDKDVLKLAKILKQGGMKLAEPQTDTESYNKAVADLADSLLPLKTRAERTIRNAEQELRERGNKALEDETESRDRDELAIRNNLDRIEDFQQQEQLKKIEQRELELEEFKRRQEIFNRQGTGADYGKLADDIQERRKKYLEAIEQEKQRGKQQIEEEKASRAASAQRAREQKKKIKAYNREQRITPEETSPIVTPIQGRTIEEATAIKEDAAQKFDWAAYTEPPLGKSKRGKQGRALLRLLEAPSLAPVKEQVYSEAGLVKALQNGYSKGIKLVQELIDDARGGHRKRYLKRQAEEQKEQLRIQAIENAKQARREEQIEFEDQLDAEDELFEHKMSESEQLDNLFDRDTDEIQTESIHDRRQIELEDAFNSKEYDRQQKQIELEDTFAPVLEDEKELEDLKLTSRLEKSEALEDLFNSEEYDRRVRYPELNAGKEILRKLRDPKYGSVKAKVKATQGLETALGQGSKQAIRQVRRWINEIDNKIQQKRERLKQKHQKKTTEQANRKSQPAQSQEPKIADLLDEKGKPVRVRNEQQQPPAESKHEEPKKETTPKETKAKKPTKQQETKKETKPEQPQEKPQQEKPVESTEGKESTRKEQKATKKKSEPTKQAKKTPEPENAPSGRARRSNEVFTPPETAGLYGNETEVISDRRKPYQVRYKVVEAGELNSSHVIDNNDIFANNNFPAELQPRNRERANMKAQLFSMANNLNPWYLVDSRNVNQGAPIIRKDNVVLNGNGRTAAIRYAYELGKANHYKEALIQNAEKFGLNADEVSKMNQPILVRELTNALSREELQDITTSQIGGAQMSASDQAKADAKKISKATLAIFPQEDELDLTTAESADFARSLLQDIATADELNKLTTSTGEISQDGINRIKRALFAKAYGDSDMVSRMSESTNDNIRNVTNALLSASPEIIKVKERMANGTLHKYNLDAINKAVNRVNLLRKQNKSVESYLAEQSLFSDTEDSEETKEILSTFDQFKRSSKKVAKFLKNIAVQIMNQGDPRQQSLFGANEKTPLINLIKRAREVAENNENIPLFSKRGSNVDTSTDNLVADKDLTPQQKLLKSFSEKLGVPIKFVDNPEGRFGGVFKDGSIFVNVKSNKPLGKVFWHESLHWLKANNPELFKQLAKAAGITTEQRQAYLEETGRDDISTPDEINEEILADQMEDVASRTGLLQTIAGKDRGLIQRAIQWLKDTLNKFIDHFRNPQGKLTTEQAIRLADEFGKIARSLVDENGNKIFRYNNRTHNIETIEGRPLQSAQTSTKPKTESNNVVKYSISNNNSSESLKQKIKDKLHAWTKSTSPRTRARITDNLHKLSRHRILYGYIDGADDIVVDHMQKLIKSRNEYDWGKLLPVVGEEIAKNLNLNATQAQSNYIADWLLTGALNKQQSAEGQAFAKAMRNNPAMAEILQETRDIFDEIANMTPQEKLASTLAERQTESWYKKIFKGSFTEEVLDDLDPLQKLVDSAIKNATPNVAEAIKQGVNVKQLAQLARGRGATADNMVNGTNLAKVRDELREQYSGYIPDDFKTISTILKSVNGDVRGLETYAVAKLIKEVYEYNRAHPEDQKTIYSGMSEAEVDTIIRDGEAKFGEAQKDLVRFSKTLLGMQYDSGLLTDNQYLSILKSWKNYVPMAQVFDENEAYDKFDPLKRRHGHAGDTWSPIQTLIAHTHTAIQACERNKVKLELATLVRFGEFDSNISEIPHSNPNVDNVITFRENGKMKYLETPDPAIKRAIDAMQSKAESIWLMKMLKATAGFMRAAYTMANPDFAAGNLMRDLPDAFIHNKQLGDTTSIIGMIRAFIRFIQVIPSAVKSVWTKGTDFIEWQMNGGAQASFVSEDVDYIQRSINDATLGDSLKARLNRVMSRNFFSATLDEFQRLSEFTENITRVASYKMAKETLTKAGKTGITGKQLAALAAREASIDFAKAGRSTRAINKAVLFANAAVQGINQWVEAFRELAKGNFKPLFGKVIRAALMGVIPALLQAAINGSDDDRKKEYEQAPDWEKDTYWIFGNFKIPKGMDFGMRLLGNLTEELFSSKPFDWHRAFYSPVWHALPSLTATLITPAVEVVQNHSYFRGAPIDPKSEQHLPAYLRYDTSTSDVAKVVGEVTGWSPRKIDYLINGYLGFIGRFVSHLPNYASRGIGFDEMPMVRRFIFTPYKNPKIVKDYYEAYEKQEQIYNGYQLERQTDKSIKTPEDYDKNYDRRLHKRIKGAYERMHEISKKEKLIMQNPNLTHSERKEKLQELEKRRVAICERVFQGAR